ncbi:MAG: PAS domain S-box protein [Herpetosiphonaceae bacterium]|nr:PAS domain S-box protein [Herpetosiphonaceae bacterium]
MATQEYVDLDRNTLGTDYIPSEPVEFWDANRQFLSAGVDGHERADQLRRQLALGSAIMHSVAEGMYAIDERGRITFVNPAAEALLGSREAELLGREAPAMMPLPDAQCTQILPGPALVEVLRSGLTYRSEHALFTRQDYSVFPVAYSAAPIITDGKVGGAVVAFHDLTEVQRLQRSQEEFLTLLSHDLRTPLAAILGHAQQIERLVEKPGLERVATGVEAILKSGRRLNRLIQDVLDRSRLEAGQALLRLEAVDLVAVLTLSIAENIPAQDRARLEVDAADELPMIADPIHIERVMVNLVTNALKYSQPGSPVVVRAFRTGQHAMVSVADQGVGIDADDVPRLFEKYYRARTAGATQGAGLGLYSSRLIVEAHGGRIWVQSEGGAGSTFWFSLPVSGP